MPDTDWNDELSPPVQLAVDRLMEALIEHSNATRRVAVLEGDVPWWVAWPKLPAAHAAEARWEKEVTERTTALRLVLEAEGGL